MKRLELPASACLNMKSVVICPRRERLRSRQSQRGNLKQKIFVNKCLTIKSIGIKLHTSTTKERSKMKTINHEGKIYQVGAVYEFSDDGKAWYVDTLEGTYQDMICPYRTRSGHGFKLIRACEVKVGTVEEAPVELIDGECYQFTDRYDDEHKGFFLAENDRLYCHTGGVVDPSKCSNFKLLVVGE